MKKGGISAILLVAFLVVLAGGSVTQAAWIKNIQIALITNTTWFNYSATHPTTPSTFRPNFSGNANVTMLSGIIDTYEGTYYAYSMKNATFNITASNLLSDSSSGGVANGQFAGGSTLNINGKLYAKDPVTQEETLLFTGLLLSADMAAASWSLVEPLPNNVTGQNNFTPASGELVTGAVAGLKIADFMAAFVFNASNGLYNGLPVTNFSSNSYKSLSPSVQITAPIPEPASMLLVALGAAVLGLRKNKKL